MGRAYGFARSNGMDEHDTSPPTLLDSETQAQEEAMAVVEPASPEPNGILTPTVYMFSTGGGSPKTIDTPPHPWEPRQQNQLSETGDGGPVEDVVASPVREKVSYEDEELDLSKKQLISEFNVAADLAVSSAERSGHTPLPEMLEQVSGTPASPTVAALAVLDDGVITRKDQAKRGKDVKKTKKDKAEAVENQEEVDEEKDPFEHLSPGNSDEEQVKKRPSAKAKAKAKGSRAKGSPKAKAKAKAKSKSSPKKKASPKASPKKTATPKKRPAAKAKAKASPKKTEPKQVKQKTPEGSEPERPRKRAAVPLDADGNRVPKSFARRYQPKNHDSSLWWAATRFAFNLKIRPVVERPSRYEDQVSKELCTYC